MLVAIEAQRIFRKQKHGMDIVALELIRQLQRIDHDNEYVVFAAPGPDNDCIEAGGNVSVQTISGFTYAGWEQFALPAALKKLRPDLVHCTANTAPLRCPCPLILTLHDVIFLESADFGGSAYQNFGNVYRRMVVPSVLKRAEAVITVSGFERDRILNYMPRIAGKLHVIPNAAAEIFSGAYTDGQVEEFRRRHKLPMQFILLLGNTAPKKNTRGALEAYRHYRAGTNEPLPLVVADYRSEPADGVIFTGYIPPEDMPLLYKASTVFLYPSLRESFGLPILEAMACGVPVITSNTSAMPEVAGDAAKLVDPNDPFVIATALEELCNDETARRALATRGLLHSQKFNWQQSAAMLTGIYGQFA